jgi:enoyl-CoA hydratase/carnithine racemase
MAVDYVKEGKVAIITINRPEKMNSLNREALNELYAAMVDFRDDPNLWVGIITGAGEKAFCAGADIKDLFLKDGDHDDSPKLPPTVMRGLEVWKPLIAAINGLAFGGGLELVLSCDLRIASETARFGLTEVNIGVMPGWGGTQRLVRMVPWCKAAEILLMGRPVDAQEAYRIGLVNKVVRQDQVMAEAREWADVMANAAPLAIKSAKEAMTRGYSMTLEEGLVLEHSLCEYLNTTKDFIEGTKAFAEKRKPDYKAE